MTRRLTYRLRAGQPSAQDELLRLDFEDGDPIKLAGLRLIRERDGTREAIVRFPELIDENPWQLDPGETIVLRTRAGHDTYYAAQGMRPTFWLHVAAEVPLWAPDDRIWIEDDSGAAMTDPLVIQP